MRKVCLELFRCIYLISFVKIAYFLFQAPMQTIQVQFPSRRLLIFRITGNRLLDGDEAIRRNPGGCTARSRTLSMANCISENCQQLRFTKTQICSHTCRVRSRGTRSPNDTQLIVGVVVVRFQDQIIRTGKSRVEGTSTKSFDICTTLCSILGTSTRGS